MPSNSRTHTHRPAPENAFEERLAGARVDLGGYARRLVPPGRGLAGPHRDHEDLVQDTLERALTHRASFDLSRPILPWLKRILLRLYLDQRKRHLASPERGRSELLADPECERSQAASAQLSMREQVQHLLARLEEPGRGILERFHLAGESIEQIAQDLGLPPGTVKSHLHRARRKLQASSLGQDPADTLEDLS